MITIGKVNKLSVVRATEIGYQLSDAEGNIVFLPLSHTQQSFSVGDKVDAFIYTDAEGRSAASLQKPVVQLNQFALLRATEVNQYGAFLKWGLEKDLFVPFAEQKKPMETEGFYIVYVYLDEVSKRIVGSSKLEKYLSNEGHSLEGGQEVDLLVYDESPLGFSCIINGKHTGLLYHNEIYQDLFIGDELTGYIKSIREDGLIDLSLQKSGFKNVLNATDIVLNYLEQHKGFLNLHDKSSPDEIMSLFNMSKATYKKAIGILYRQRKVLIKPDGVYLVPAENSEANTTSE